MQITHKIQQLLNTPPESHLNEPVTVAGWIKSRRDSKGGFSFLQINDGSCLSDLQVVADAQLNEYETVILNLTTGCAVQVRGSVKPGQGKQAVELHADAVTLVGDVQDAATYPIAKKRHSFEFLREVAHLRPRTNTFGAVARVRHATAKAIHDFFDQQGFYWVNTPIITASDCEGAGELFRVSTLDFYNLPHSASGIDYTQDFFDQPTYLTVSGQLNVESFCLALSNVYTFGPTFRAENSHTSRHLAEFWMVEPEIAFADLTQVSALAETFLTQVVNQVLNQCSEDLEFFNQRIDTGLISRLQDLVNKPFERMSYSQAIDVLKQAKTKFEFPVAWGADLQSEHERYLSEVHVKSPLIVYDYPKEIKAFYMRENDDDKTCAALDVLAPGIGEIIGGSQREERFDRLEAKLTTHGLSDSLGWYQDLRRYGTVPHGGFGLGFERLLNYLTGLDNIRDVIPFPRTPGNARF